MADKKITELDVSQTIAADDSVFANIGGSARQVAISLILALLEDVYAPLDSPALEGTPTAPTPADTDDSTRIATTAFIKSLLEDYAKLASPTFTGTPKTSTPISTDDSTRIPTTAWVKDRIAEANTGGESGGGGGSGGLSVSYDNESGNIVFSDGGGSSGGTSEKEWVKEEITIQTGTTLYQLNTVGADEFLIVFDNSLTGIFTSSSKVFGSLIASIIALSKGKSLYIKRTNDKFIAFGQRGSDLLTVMSTADVVEEGIELVTSNNNGKIYFYKR